MALPVPQTPLVLDDETLRQLRAETELYAAYWVDLYRWRGEYGGVLADGYDPASIASDAWFQVFPPTNHTNGAPSSQSLFLASLGNQHKLKTLFRHLCAGHSDARTLPRSLKLKIPAVLSLKKRLRRR